METLRPHQMRHYCDTKFGKKLFINMARSQTNSCHAHQPASTFLSLHYLNPELVLVVSMQNWQKKAGSGQETQQRNFLQLSPG